MDVDLRGQVSTNAECCLTAHIKCYSPGLLFTIGLEVEIITICVVYHKLMPAWKLLCSITDCSKISSIILPLALHLKKKNVNSLSARLL